MLTLDHALAHNCCESINTKTINGLFRQSKQQTRMNSTYEGTFSTLKRIRMLSSLVLQSRFPLFGEGYLLSLSRFTFNWTISGRFHQTSWWCCDINAGTDEILSLKLAGRSCKLKFWHNDAPHLNALSFPVWYYLLVEYLCNSYNLEQWCLCTSYLLTWSPPLLRYGEHWLVYQTQLSNGKLQEGQNVARLFGIWIRKLMWITSWNELGTSPLCWLTLDCISLCSLMKQYLKRCKWDNSGLPHVMHTKQ